MLFTMDTTHIYNIISNHPKGSLLVSFIVYLLSFIPVETSISTLDLILKCFQIAAAATGGTVSVLTFYYAVYKPRREATKKKPKK